VTFTLWLYHTRRNNIEEWFADAVTSPINQLSRAPSQRNLASMSLSMPLPRLAFLSLLTVILTVILTVLGACGGGRTALYLCSTEGATSSCSNTCGDGVKTCTGSLWSACVVQPVRLSCSNTCGEGTRLCQNNQLASLCEVDAIRLPCSNTCGQGTQLCENDQLKGTCEVAPVVKDCSSLCGSGTKTCVDNKWQTCTAPEPNQPTVKATVRDFHITFPDMNHDGVSETGIVASTLGDDDKPVYAHSGSTETVSGPDTFYKWYRDVSDVNISTTIDIPLTLSNSSKGVYSYRNTSFFPIDNQLFSNEGQTHNYAFTVEVATRFRYNGGETFTFAGDDDVFVFINRNLAIDLGGIHSMLSQTVDLDAQADQLGIEKGGIYSMHIFFAERHMTGSDFVIETTISEFNVCN
jgi:fibro-slime domain-containing protein